MATSNLLVRLACAVCVAAFILSATLSPTLAGEAIKPFVLAAKSSGADLSSLVADTSRRLQAAGFEIVGQYSPYQNAQIIAFTSDTLRDVATRSERGGYGAVLRASVTSNDGEIELAYTNPIYWASAYRLSENLDSVSRALKSALEFQREFGTGKNEYSVEDMRGYHYTFMMEYFDDPSLLANYGSHREAVDAVGANLPGPGVSEVYRLGLGSDSEDKQMTVFGIALTGRDEDDCSGDRYIMDRIDKSSPRHTAHLPYELLVYGNNVQALYARFRIAISWPHLPMMTSDNGATFMSIMCAPGAIEKALTQIAGGNIEKPGVER